MTYYMYRETGKPTGMIITELELKKLQVEPLIGSSQETDGKFKCVVAYQGKTHTFNKHTTIEACNAQYTRELKKLHAISKPRKRRPAAKGYRVRQLSDGTKSYDVYLEVRTETVFKGKRKSEAEARKLYLDSFVEEFGEIEK